MNNLYKRMLEPTWNMGIFPRSCVFPVKINLVNPYVPNKPLELLQCEEGMLERRIGTYNLMSSFLK